MTMKRANITREIVQSLRHLGGQADKQALIDDLRHSDNDLSQDYIDWVKTSKSGNTYKPFNYDLNFGISYLELTGYLTRPQRSTLHLTPLGETCELPEDFGTIVTQKGNHLLKQSKQTSPETPVEELDELVDMVDKQRWEDQLLTALKHFTPQKFEQFSRLLVSQMGIKLDKEIGVKISNDGGLDGFGHIVSHDDFRTNRVAIQAKRWEGTVQSPEIDRFRGAMIKHHADYGIFITTSSFSKGARKAALQANPAITLIDGEKIAELVTKYQLHVTQVISYELDDYYKE